MAFLFRALLTPFETVAQGKKIVEIRYDKPRNTVVVYGAGMSMASPTKRNGL